MIDLLKPELTVERPPPSDGSARYVRSYLIMRIFIGAIGVSLPFVLVLVDAYLSGDGLSVRDSLSAYYYSGAREFFVGALCATGVFLITYKVAERTLDNTLSVLAGFAAVFVALFPTGLPDGAVGLTPLQDKFDEGRVEAIHFAAAGIFICSLGGICYIFSLREGARPPRPGKRSPAFWRNYHLACTGAIALAVGWILATAIFGGPDEALFIGETAAVLAFGASWFMKGFELDMLKGRN